MLGIITIKNRPVSIGAVSEKESVSLHSHNQLLLLIVSELILAWLVGLHLFDSARSHWDLAADDDVFLETMQVVSAARYGSIDQHASGVLEGRSG